MSDAASNPDSPPGEAAGVDVESSSLAVAHINDAHAAAELPPSPRPFWIVLLTVVAAILLLCIGLLLAAWRTGAPPLG